MKRLNPNLLTWFALTCCSVLTLSSLSAQTVPIKAPAGSFVCADSLKRANGKLEQTHCKLATEYCYEGTGGPAISHGAKCVPFPNDNRSCKGFKLEAGGSCMGDAATGIRINFAFP